LKAERKAYWDRVAEEFEVAAHRHEYRSLYSTLRRLRGKTRQINENIRKSDGTFTRSSCERLSRWKEYFQQLYNHAAPDGTPAEPPYLDHPGEHIPEDEPSLTEIKLAIHQLKRGKAAGEDEITAEALKAGGDPLLQQLHSLLRLIWVTEEIPNTWKRAIVVPIFKKGDSQECKNYRGISLLSILGKVFMRIIQQRVQKRREQAAREEQAGFRPGRGCCDQIFTLRQLMEERIRCGKPLIVVFIDFAAAFDSVHRPSLWKALAAEGIPVKLIRLLQQVYNGSTSCVRIKNELTNEFPVISGVRQGCVLSPLLFNVVVDAIMRKVFEGRQGVKFGQDQFITDLMYADDSAIFAENETEATQILHDIKTIAHPFGLKINTDKTKVLSSDGSPVIVQLDGVQLEQVNEFKYLGSIIQEQKIASTNDIQTRIGLAATAFGTLTWCLWKKRNISIATKMRIYQSLVLSVLLYGAESWTLLQSDIKKLEVFHMRCLRRVLGISLRDRIRNETIRERCCNQPTISEEIQKRRLRWFGHVCRMEPQRLPYQLLWRTRPSQWKIIRTAPKKIWSKQVENDLANRRLTLRDAKNIALDRQQWKELIHHINDPVAPTAAYWIRGRPQP
jgi:hypothetical protein